MRSYWMRANFTLQWFMLPDKFFEHQFRLLFHRRRIWNLIPHSEVCSSSNMARESSRWEVFCTTLNAGEKKKLKKWKISRPLNEIYYPEQILFVPSKNNARIAVGRGWKLCHAGLMSFTVKKELSWQKIVLFQNWVNFSANGEKQSRRI